MSRYPLEIVIYQTSDRCEFRDKDEAEKHENYLARTEGSLYWAITGKGIMSSADPYRYNPDSIEI